VGEVVYKFESVNAVDSVHVFVNGVVVDPVAVVIVNGVADAWVCYC